MNNNEPAFSGYEEPVSREDIKAAYEDSLYVDVGHDGQEDECVGFVSKHIKTIRQALEQSLDAQPPKSED